MTLCQAEETRDKPVVSINGSHFLYTTQAGLPMLLQHAAPDPRFAVAIRETSSWWLPARTMLMSCSLLPENDSLVRLLAASLKLIQSPPLQGPETSVQNGGPFQGLGLGQDLSTRINDDHHFLCSPIYIDHFGADTLSVTCTYLIV